MAKFFQSDSKDIQQTKYTSKTMMVNMTGSTAVCFHTP